MKESEVKCYNSERCEKVINYNVFRYKEDLSNVSYKDIKEWKNNPITKALMKTFYKFNIYNKHKGKSILIALHPSVNKKRNTILHFMIRTDSTTENLD